jgi:hypothetical protein
MNEPDTPDIPVLNSRAGFIAALKWGFGAAFEQGARRIVCCDATFAEWPLDDASLLQGLTTWLKRPQRRLVLLARSYDEVPRRCPRFTAWRSDWAHAMEAWVAPEEMAADLPTLLVSDGAVSVHLIDAVHWRGRAERDERRARHWCEELDVVLQRSERGFGVNTLGL